VFLFRVGRFGRLGPWWFAFLAYRMWRRLSPQQKAAIRARVGGVVGQVRRARTNRAAMTAVPSTMSRVGSATAPREEIPPSDR
jgi:hypothetical protein